MTFEQALHRVPKQTVVAGICVILIIVEFSVVAVSVTNYFQNNQQNSTVSEKGELSIYLCSIRYLFQKQFCFTECPNTYACLLKNFP